VNTHNCESTCDEAIQLPYVSGLLRYARNDEEIERDPMNIEYDLKAAVRTIPDYPKPESSFATSPRCSAMRGRLPRGR